MKTLIIFLLFLSYNAGILYSQTDRCSTQTTEAVRTDPNNAINERYPSKTNTDGRILNWMDKQFDVNCMFFHSGVNRIESPFNQTNNIFVNHFLDNKDNKPEDGWELICRQFGYNDDGLLDTDENNPYLVLYNRYLGLIRVFALVGNNKADYSYGKISMRFLSGDEHVTTSLLDFAISDSLKPFRALNDFPSRASGIDFNNYSMHNLFRRVSNMYNWFYADFPVNYDPCTCLSKSKLFFEVEMMTQANLNMTGTLEKTVVDLGNSYNNDNSALIDDTGKSLTLSGFGGNIVETFKSFNRFNVGLKHYIKEFHKSDSLKKDKALASLNVFNETLREGMATDALKIMPEVGNISEMLDYFIIGGKTYPTTIKHAPTAIQSNLAVSGSITAYKFQSIIFWNPGSNFTSSSFDDRQYPIYDQVLGTFNLLRAPKIAVNKSSFVECKSKKLRIFPRKVRFDNRYTISDTFSVNLHEQIQYVLNPVAFSTNPDDVTILASIEFDLEPTKYLYFRGTDISATGLEHVKDNTYRSKYFPIQCLTDEYFKFVVTTDATDFWHKEECGELSVNPISLTNFKVRLLNFYKRNDLENHPNADDIMEMRTYLIGEIVYTENLNNTDDYSISGYHESLVLENTTISSDITAWGDIEIGENVTVSGSNTYYIKSIYGSTYVKNGANVVPNLILQSGHKSACNIPMYAPVSFDDVMDFCKSNSKDGYRPEIRRMGPSSMFYEDALHYSNIEPSHTLSLDVYPSPAHSTVNIKFDHSESQNIRIVISNPLGKILAIPVDNSNHPHGEFTIPIDVSHFSQGVYFCTLYSPQGIITKSFVVVK
ncbi:MAG: T9SS type A sorting domain-containing protein [Candidatus Kapabacteria bacterium]|nr:T9SS type A sorting domain-containing protein [Candidatus Kapabacteria bacterium]